MLLKTPDFFDEVLFAPIRDGANSLKIVSGYATHTMASWHIKEIKSQKLQPVEITLVVGMCPFDGISVAVHEGFKALVGGNGAEGLSRLRCQYVHQGSPVHSKLYLWEKDCVPFRAYTGSANYTQSAFSQNRREILHECDPFAAWSYYRAVDRDSIYCNHSEIEDHVRILPSHPALDMENSPLISIRGAGVEQVALSLLTEDGETGAESGLNWGQRRGRNRNQAYISVPAEIGRGGFFPVGELRSGRGCPHFTVLTDDGRHLILRAQQQNCKAITTPHSNALLGEYFRNRLGLGNGEFVTRRHLEEYGRTDVAFYRLDDELYFMDFSVP